MVPYNISIHLSMRATEVHVTMLSVTSALLHYCEYSINRDTYKIVLLQIRSVNLACQTSGEILINFTTSNNV